MLSTESQAHAVLQALSQSAGDGALLWRGAGVGGSDVDLVLKADVAAAAAAVFSDQP